MKILSLGAGETGRVGVLKVRLMSSGRVLVVYEADKLMDETGLLKFIHFPLTDFYKTWYLRVIPMKIILLCSR